LLRTDGVGAGRVEYVLVICPLCHQLLHTAGWLAPGYDVDGDAAWTPLLPPAPARYSVGPRRDGLAHADGLSLARRAELRSAGRGSAGWAPFRGSAARRAPALRRGIRGRAGSHHPYHGATSRRWRWAQLAMLGVCVAAFVCALAGAVLYL
jgi:hypothetical protein